MKKRTAPEVIGFHLGWDMRDVSDCRYQPSRYASPAIYTLGDDYWCCPSGTQKPSADFNWTAEATHYGRTIYRAKGA